MESGRRGQMTESIEINGLVIVIEQITDSAPAVALVYFKIASCEVDPRKNVSVLAES